MDNLTQDLVYVLLEWLDSFADILVVTSAKFVYQSLVEITPGLCNKGLLYHPQHTKQQLNLFRYLQRKYRLPEVESPSFPKLVWQYLHATSGSVFNRLKYVVQTKKLNIWDNEDYCVLSDIIPSMGEQGDIPNCLHESGFTNHIDEYQLKELTILAYNNNNLSIADELYRCLSFCLATGAVYSGDVRDAELEAEIRQILSPHKLVPTRKIFRDNSDKLYSREVNDAEKRNIWVSQYDGYKHVCNLQNLYHIDQVTAYAGILTGETDGYLQEFVTSDDFNSVNGDVHKWAWLAACKIANLEVINRILEAQDEHSGYFVLDEYIIARGICILIKRGYWQTLAAILTTDYHSVVRMPEARELFIHLQEHSVQEINAVISAVKDILCNIHSVGSLRLSATIAVLSDPQALLRLAIALGNYRLFQELRINGSGNWLLGELHTHVINYGRVSVGMFADIVDRESASQIEILRKIFVEHGNFWLKLWQEHGKQQFEDSLTYLQDTFGIEISPVRLLMDLTEDDLSLIEYLLGWRFMKGTLQPYPGSRLLDCIVDIEHHSELNFKALTNKDRSDMAKFYSLVAAKYASVIG